MIKQHAGAALVAAGIVAAALIEGAFDPTAYAALSIVIWAAVVAGLASRSLPSNRITVTAAVAGVFLAAGVLLAGASVAWASDQGRAFDEAVRLSAYLGLFTLAVCTASDAGRREWLAGLTAGLAAVAILAVFSYLQPGLLDDRELAQLIPDADARLAYPIGYWNGLGALLAIAAVLLADAGARAGDRRLRTAAVAAMPVVVLGIWLTGSRGAAAAALIGLAVLVMAGPNRSRQLPAAAIGVTGGAVLILLAEQMGALVGEGRVDAAAREQGDWLSLGVLAMAVLTAAAAWLLDGAEPRPRISRPVAIAIATLGVIAIAVAIAIADPAERFREFKQPPTADATAGEVARGGFASSGRWQFWDEAVDAFESAPVAGIGAGAYEDWWARNASIPVFVRNPHSLPLQQLAELGLLGAGLMIGFSAALIVAAYRRLAAGREAAAGVLIAVIAAAAISAAIDWTWEMPAVIAPAVIAAGLLSASAPGRKLGRDAYAFGLGTLAIAWISIVAGALVVLTELKLEQSRSAAADGQIAEAIDRALEARTVQPWSPEPYTQLALLEEARGDPDEAVRRLDQAQQRDSEDWRLALIEARLQKARGDELAARNAVDRVRELSPEAPSFSGG